MYLQGLIRFIKTLCGIPRGLPLEGMVIEKGYYPSFTATLRFITVNQRNV
jgi:hypothetical protein